MQKWKPVWVAVSSLPGCEAGRESGLDGVTAGGISSSCVSEVIFDCAHYHTKHTVPSGDGLHITQPKVWE